MKVCGQDNPVVPEKTSNAESRTEGTLQIRKFANVACSVAVAGFLTCGTHTYAEDFHFEIVKGKTNPVCRVYRSHLMNSRFVEPPQCGIPKTDLNDEIEELTKVPLTPIEASDLYGKVYGLVDGLGQEQNNVLSSKTEIEKMLGNEIHAWRYEPRPSVTNDGVRQNVLVWQGFGIDKVPFACGDPYYTGDVRHLSTSTQLAFVLDASGKKIDEPLTKSLFGRPGAQGRLVELGGSVGLFKFHGRYYIESFYSSGEGDFLGKRQGDRVLDSTLAVAMMASGHSSRICEIRMTSRR